MASTVVQPIRWRLLAGRSILAVLAYFVLLIAAAASSRVSSGKEPALIAWIVATLVLLIMLLRVARQTAALTGPLVRASIAAGSVAAGVAVAAFLGFVVMVNVWEMLGLGH
jgi:hypothetical protein